MKGNVIIVYGESYNSYKFSGPSRFQRKLVLPNSGFGSGTHQLDPLKINVPLGTTKLV